MITITLTGYESGATDLYAYYLDQSLDDYVADKAPFTEGSGSDLGKYTAVVDETKGTQIVAFVGATQPASWAEALVGVSWDLLIAAIKADPDLGTSDGGLVAEVNKIPRAAAAVTAGAAQQKHLENSLGATLQTVYEVHDGDVA